MNIRRFTARTSREALVLVRQALGEDAVVLSTKPSAEGVEVLAMAPDGLQQIEQMAERTPAARAEPDGRREPVMSAAQDTAADVAQLAMSTLSFQDYVRERMLRRRQNALKAESAAAAGAAAPATVRTSGPAEHAGRLEQRMNGAAPAPVSMPAPPRREPPLLREAIASLPMAASTTEAPSLAHTEAFAMPMAPGRSMAAGAGLPIGVPPGPPVIVARPLNEEPMLAELRAMKGLIEERFGALAYIEKLNRQPAQVRLIQKLLDGGFSPALIKKIGDSLPMDAGDETAWAASVLERNLYTGEAEPALEDQGGVYALVGATGVGKTTTTAKIAAAFAARYGAANLGLITLDAYRIGAHEQLRAYGRILGVPVHTAHDRASLEDLLELLAAKKMVLIDTAGMAQRDARTRELLEMVSHRSIRKLLVINAASQGETIEDVMVAYHAQQCAGIVLSKMDEAVKLGPALDATIRMKLKIVGVANGQRVPEDWHRLTSAALVHRALRTGGSSAYRLDASDLSLVFTAPAAAAPGGDLAAAPAVLRRG